MVCCSGEFVRRRSTSDHFLEETYWSDTVFFYDGDGSEECPLCKPWRLSTREEKISFFFLKEPWDCAHTTST